MAKIAAYARPNRLFRFRSLTDQTIDRELSAIADGYIFCPHFDEMNDPMEGGHRESALLKESKEYKTTIAAVSAEVAKVGIASFSEVFDHEPMWAHYADKFSGICVGYSFRRLLSYLPEDHELVRMTYSEIPPILLKDGQPTQHHARLILSTKTLRWSSEREWRLIRPTRGEARSSRRDTVTRVYLGSRMKPEHRRAVITALKVHKIPIFGMKVDQYALNFSRLLFRS